MSNKKIILNSSIYSMLGLLQKGINFFMVPILTLYLTVYDYGVVAVITAMAAFLNILYSLSLNASINRFYYEYTDDIEKLKRFFGSIITFVMALSLTLSLILGLGHRFFLDPFLENVEFYPYMLLGMISVLFNPIFTIYQDILQAKQKGTEFGKNNLLFFLTNLVLVLLGVVVFRLGAVGVIGALSVTNILFCILTIVRYRKEFSFGIHRGPLKEALTYSLPLVPHSLSGVATSIIDRLFINHYLSTALVGIYSLGSTFGGIVFLISSGVNQAFVPWFNEQVKANDTTKIPRVAKLLLLSYCLIALGISLLGKEVIAWVTPQIYHQAWTILPFISFAFVYHGVYYFFSTPLFYNIEKKGSKILPIFTISAALINIALNYIFILQYGMVGASVATLVTKFALVIGLSQVYRKYVDVDYPILFMLVLPALFFTVALLVFCFSDSQYLSLRIVIFAFAAILTCFIAKKEVMIIKKG